MRALLGCALVLVACNSERGAVPPTAITSAAPGLPPVDATSLRPVAAFSAIANAEQRSAMLFVEASRVMLHPRCANCHPRGDTPLQGMEMRAHDPPVSRGDDDRGVVGMRCEGCHQETNLDLARVPGAPKWHVAPKEMAWVGRTPHELCEQVKDPKRNGGRSLAQLVDHSAHDELVGWGWHPGHGREKAPGDQQQFGALMQAWVDSGAHCPSPGLSEAR
jgi:hypothetical protein